MKIPVLDNLQHELNRMFIAGSKFSQNDPRIAKLIPILQKMGEKAPIMNRLAAETEKLIKCSPEESAIQLAETANILYSVLNTQGECDTAYEIKSNVIFHDELPKTTLSYTNLISVICALTASYAGRYEYMKYVYKSNLYNDDRLNPFFSRALDDKSVEIVSIVREKIIPAIGKKMIPHLLKDFNFEGKRSAAMRFTLLSELGYEKIDELCENIINSEASSNVLVAATEYLGNSLKNENILEQLVGSKKQAVREAALCSLVKLDSENAKQKMMEILKSKKYTPALTSIRYCTDVEYINQIKELILSMIDNVNRKKDYDEKKVQYVIDIMENTAQSKNQELYFEIYTEALKNFPSRSLSVLRILSQNHNEKVFEYFKTVDKKFFISHNDFASFLRSYFYVALNYCDEVQIYDTFAQYYKDDIINGSFFNDIFFEHKVDSRWADLFTKKKAYIQLDKLTRNNELVSEYAKNYLSQNKK